jgi:translation initiation factor IF-3
MHFSKDVKDQ